LPLAPKRNDYFMKPRLLAIIHLPPPVHGTTLMNSFVAESVLLKEHFDLQIVPIRFCKKVSEIGRFAFRKIGLSIRLFSAVGRQLIMNRPDLVYMTPAVTGIAFYREMLLMGLVKIFRCKIVLHLHGKGIYEASANPAKRVLYRMFFHHTSPVCSSTRLTYDIERVYRGTPYIVPNGIRDITENSKTLSRDQKMDPVHFLYISNITKGKGIFEFLDALQVLKQNGTVDFQAHIGGQPNDVTAAELTGLIQNKNLKESVTYKGALSERDKDLELEWADIFVFPTKIDVFGVVLLEAMQHRLPTIASRMAAIPDVVKDGETGFLVEPGSVQDLAEKMERLAGNSELQRVMGQNGFEHYKANFTVEVFERNLKTVFEKVLSAPMPRGNF
jgi:glycosyltransferase involved in cell wall biosynthesis